MNYYLHLNVHVDVCCYRKQVTTKEREYLKQKKLKKQMRFQQLEAERECEKNKWLTFSSKVSLLYSSAGTLIPYWRALLLHVLKMFLFISCDCRLTKKVCVKRVFSPRPTM